MILLCVLYTWGIWGTERLDNLTRSHSYLALVPGSKPRCFCSIGHDLNHLALLLPIGYMTWNACFLNSSQVRWGWCSLLVGIRQLKSSETGHCHVTLVITSFNKRLWHPSYVLSIVVNSEEHSSKPDLQRSPPSWGLLTCRVNVW